MRKRRKPCEEVALKVSLCDNEGERPAGLSHLSAGGVGDHTGDVEFITAVMGGLREDLVLLAGRFRAVTVGVWELRPANPGRVSNDQIELTRSCRPKEITNDPKPDAVPALSMQTEHWSYVLFNGSAHFLSCCRPRTFRFASAALQPS